MELFWENSQQILADFDWVLNTPLKLIIGTIKNNFTILRNAKLCNILKWLSSFALFLPSPETLKKELSVTHIAYINFATI